MDHATPQSASAPPQAPPGSFTHSDGLLLQRYANVILDFGTDRQPLRQKIGAVLPKIQPVDLQEFVNFVRLRLQHGQYLCEVGAAIHTMKHLLAQADEAMRSGQSTVHLDCINMLEVIYYTSMGRTAFRYMVDEERLNVAKTAHSSLTNTKCTPPIQAEVVQAIKLTAILHPATVTDEEMRGLRIHDYGPDVTAEMLKLKSQLFRLLLGPQAFTAVQIIELFEEADRLFHSPASLRLKTTCFSLVMTICPERSVVYGASIILPKLARDMKTQWELDGIIGLQPIGQYIGKSDDGAGPSRTKFVLPEVDQQAVAETKFNGISDEDVVFDSALDALKFLSESRRQLELPRGEEDDVYRISQNKGYYINEVVKALVSRPKLSEDPTHAQERKVKEKMEKSFQDELDRLDDPVIVKRTLVAIATLIVDQLIELHLHGDSLHLSQMVRNVKYVDWALKASERMGEVLHTLLHSKDACKDLLKDAGKGAIINLVAAPVTTYQNKFQWAKNNAKRAENTKTTKWKLAAYDRLVASKEDQADQNDTGATTNESEVGIDDSSAGASQREQSPEFAQDDNVSLQSGAATAPLHKTKGGRVSKQSSRKA